MKFSLKGIIAISGKPGLYKVLAQGNNNVIVESLIDKKRFPAYSSNKISALEDITMYSTGEEDKPLHEVIKAIFDKENGGPCVDAKEEGKHLSYLAEVFPDFDKDRIYTSDIRKLFSWYNLMHSSGELKRIAEEAAKEEEEAPAVAEKAEKKEKKTTAKEKESPKEKKSETKTADKKEKKEAAAEKKKTTTKKADSKTTKKAPAAKKAKGGGTVSKAKTTVKNTTGSKRGS